MLTRLRLRRLLAASACVIATALGGLAATAPAASARGPTKNVPNPPGDAGIQARSRVVADGTLAWPSGGVVCASSAVTYSRPPPGARCA